MRQAAAGVAGLLVLAGAVMSAEPNDAAAGPKADAEKETQMQGPRKVVIGTAKHPMWGEFHGLEARLAELGRLVDEMAAEAREQYDDGLDLAVLPEYAVTGTPKGPASTRCVPLEGPVMDAFGAKAREHDTYICFGIELAEDRQRGLYSNAAVLVDRKGEVVGIYRKVYLVASRADGTLEGGMTPGRMFPVFETDFGRVGMQICQDMVFDAGWRTLAERGAEIVAWPTQSPQTIRPACRALEHGYFIVSSTWRNNAAVFDPAGHAVAQVRDDDGGGHTLVTRIDLSYALLGWQPKLRNGAAFDEAYGERAGYRYSEAEDGGIFWSNDPETPIMEMVRELGLETWAESLARQRAAQDAGRGGPVETAPASDAEPAAD